MPNLRINDITYDIVLTEGTATPTYSITFSIPAVAAPDEIRYRKQKQTTIDSGRHDPSDQTPSYTYEFTGLTGPDIEGNWIIEWGDDHGKDAYVDILIIPNSAITVPTGDDGLTPSPESVDVILTGNNSPYVSKKVIASDFTMGLETFSVAAEYNPVKVYTLSKGARAIMLEVNDYVPSSFGPNREDWILYSILIENEVYPITPRNRAGQYPTVYHLNSPLVGPVRLVREDNNEGFIDTTSGKITQVGIKVELGRPEAQASATPIVFGYKLKYIDYE